MDMQTFFNGLDQAFASRQHNTIAHYLQQHLHEAQQTHNVAAMITILNEMAGYYRSISQHQEAIAAGEQAIILMQQEKLNDSVAYGTTLLNTATAYSASGNTNKALQLYEQTLQIYLTQLAYDDLALAGLYNNMGALYLSMDNPLKAAEILQKALPIVTAAQNVSGETATIYTNLAQALLRLGKHDEALQVLSTAMHIFEAHPTQRDPHYAAALAANGQIYFALKEYNLAVQAYEAALQHIKGCYGENKDFAITCDNCATALAALGEHNKAQVYKDLAQTTRARLTKDRSTSASSPEQHTAPTTVAPVAPITKSLDTGHVPSSSEDTVMRSVNEHNQDNFLGSMFGTIDALLTSSSPTSDISLGFAAGAIPPAADGTAVSSAAAVEAITRIIRSQANASHTNISATQATSSSAAHTSSAPTISWQEAMAQPQVRTATEPTAYDFVEEFARAAAQTSPQQHETTLNRLFPTTVQDAPTASLTSATSSTSSAPIQEQRQHIPGMELARGYYENYGKEMIRSRFPGYEQRIAIGLVGEGSECFGFDDAISTDHDFGPAFCMWLTQEDYQAIGSTLQKAYEELPESYKGYAVRKETPMSQGRIGALCMETFYHNYIGSPNAQLRLTDWLRIPESHLATVTNGAVFYDPLTRFSQIRQQLLAFYPEDVRIKKIAARAAGMGQSGQYNYARCMSRGEIVAAGLALQEFVRQTCSMVFLLNRKYTPFYKWMHRSMRSLPLLGKEIAEMIQHLATSGLHMQHWQNDNPFVLAHSINKADPNVLLIEDICNLIRQQLYRDRLSNCRDSFLANHAPAIINNIADDTIRSLHILEG